MTKHNAKAVTEPSGAHAATPTERTVAVNNIYGAFLNVCKGVTNVKRTATGQVGQQKYKYATLDQVLDMINPLLEQNGLALAQYVDDDVLRAILIHESGERLPFGGYNLGVLGKHQERGSAITYGRRYQLCSIFGITQEDDDGAEASKPKTNSPTSGHRTAQQEFGTAANFKKYYTDTSDAIKRMINKEQADILRQRILRVELVDEQSAMNLQDELELRLDDLHLQG